jgi:glycosyltransferase involved in cell wall biosynthesis
MTPMTDPLVTVVTATTGQDHLLNCIRSVRAQNYKNIQHLVFADGPKSTEKVKELLNGSLQKFSPHDATYVDLVELPYPVGNNQWNGHRMYAAGTFLADDSAEYIMFLDDDNTIDPDHISSLVELIIRKKLHWAFSFRKIVDADGKFVCNDDCESLGHWPSVLNEHDKFVDVNCYLFHRSVALSMAPVWYRKFRQQGQMEIDRAISMVVMEKLGCNYDTTYKYSVNYKVGNSPLSVQASFFEAGNRAMLAHYNGELPWKQELK